MTGKDFSGPIPEIMAPTPVRSDELEQNQDPESLPVHRVVQKKSRTPSVHDTGVEIIGDIDEVEKDDATDLLISS